MMVIAENINVINKKLAAAMKERKKEPIQHLAKLCAKNQVDYLDLNIGPAKKDGPFLMEWIIKTVREVTDLPLSLDTTNIEAIKVGLEMEGEKAMINSVQATPERMEILFPLIQQYHCRFIALLLGKGGMPRDATERGSLAAEFAAAIDQAGLPHENVFFDPIVLPVAFQQDQVVATLEFMKMLSEMLPDFESTCGLSNVSNGVPEELRPLVNRTYLALLLLSGLESAIADGLDNQLIDLARGKREDIMELIKSFVEKKTDMGTLSPEQQQIAKTAAILTGQSIYSHSWLKL
ncbi:MAG: dihydropteroate synthase [Candidatus Omnitrophica bacterium]|nr:dihydropteroate synthase [Candidatus Omnitrophota bacterium]